MFTRFGIAAALAVAAIAPAHASIYDNTFSVFVSEGTTTGSFSSVGGNPFTGANTASATFTYTGPLNFSNNAGPVTTPTGDLNSTFGFSTTNISGYTGSGTVTAAGTQVADFSTVTSFLASSGSSAPYRYATYQTFGLGNVIAGTVLTIRHDDGVSIFQNGVQVGPTVTGATGAVTDTVRFTASGTTELRYTRQNSTPSILQVAVPEPMSVGLLGAGLAALGLVRRKKNAA